MGKVLIDESILQGWADVVREKQGIDDLMKPSVLLEKTREIESGGQGGSGEDGIAKLLTDTLESYSNSDITTIRNSGFCTNKNLEFVDLPNVETLEAYAFFQCESLISVNMPKLKKINGNQAFSFCKSLREIYLPELENTYTGDFLNCINLTKVNLPKVQELYASIFEGCEKLSQVDIGVKTQLLRDKVFRKCTSLNTLILRGTEISTLAITTAFTDTPIENGTGYIYVPKALIEEYKVATNWTTFANQFRAIEDYPEICGGETE